MPWQVPTRHSEPSLSGALFTAAGDESLVQAIYTESRRIHTEADGDRRYTDRFATNGAGLSIARIGSSNTIAENMTLILGRPQMMLRSLLYPLLLVCLVRPAASETVADLAQQVRAAESAFADTMAKRDLKAFATYLDEEAVFFGGDDALRGKAAVVEGWKAFFEGANAPFSWTPESVEVLDSGALAHSSGPVYDAQGKRVATFNSIWRRGEDGRWRVVFDKGCNTCACAGKQ